MAQSTTVDGLLVAQCLSVSALLGLFFSLTPIPSGEGAVSDGLGAIQSMLLSEEDLCWRLALPYVAESARCVDAEHWHTGIAFLQQALSRLPNNQLLTLAELGVVARQGEAGAALERLRALGTPDDYAVLVRGEMLHTGALIALETGESALFPEAVASCQRAVELNGGSNLVSNDTCSPLAGSGLFKACEGAAGSRTTGPYGPGV